MRRQRLGTNGFRAAGKSYVANDHGEPPATEKQVRALHAFVRRAGVRLADELQDRFGVITADVLTRRQANEAIDGLKTRVEN